MKKLRKKWQKNTKFAIQITKESYKSRTNCIKNSWNKRHFYCQLRVSNFGKIGQKLTFKCSRILINTKRNKKETKIDFKKLQLENIAIMYSKLKDYSRM